MPQTEFSVVMVRIDFICDACGNGHMRPTGIMLASDLPKWTHACNSCGSIGTFDNTYPNIGYREAPAT